MRRQVIKESFHKVECHLMTRESPDTDYQILFPRIVTLRPRAFSLGTGHIQSVEILLAMQTLEQRKPVHSQRRNQIHMEEKSQTEKIPMMFTPPPVPDSYTSPVAFVPLFLLFIFWPCQVACGILVPQPGIKPVPTALRSWSLNHQTAREVPCLCL